MSSQATAAPLFFDQKLISTRDPETARVSPSAWVENLVMGTHAAIQLAQNLQAEMRGGAPERETMHALYGRVMTLASAHESNPSNPSYSCAISEPLREARELTQTWYTSCFNPERSGEARDQACPTPFAVSELLNKLKSIVATDEDGNQVLDLVETARPFIDRYNVSCKPHQVFDTPAELFDSGRPLAWMSGK
jgi:hypothetical protein